MNVATALPISSSTLPCCSVSGTTEHLLRCDKCKSVFYCSTQHQHIDWPAHKLECRLLAKQKNNSRMQQLQQAVAAASLHNRATDTGNIQSNVLSSSLTNQAKSFVASDVTLSPNLVLATTTDSESPGQSSPATTLLSHNFAHSLTHDQNSYQAQYQAGNSANNLTTNASCGPKSAAEITHQHSSAVLQNLPKTDTNLEMSEMPLRTFAAPLSQYGQPLLSTHHQNQYEKSSSYVIGKVDVNAIK